MLRLALRFLIQDFFRSVCFASFFVMFGILAASSRDADGGITYNRIVWFFFAFVAVSLIVRLAVFLLLLIRKKIARGDDPNDAYLAFLNATKINPRTGY